MIRPILVIVGPTAGGKTALSLQLATNLPGGGECICADSMQVYRGMDIGTAKPTAEEQAIAPHHLIDLVEPDADFTVDDWLTLAEQTIAEVRARNHWPIVVGGTNLYIKSLLEGMFDGPPADKNLRAELDELSLDQLRDELLTVDPAAAERIHRNDRRRTTRAIEVFRQTGQPISELQTQWDIASQDPEGVRGRDDAWIIGLDYPAEIINPRINARVKQMIEDGLVDEVLGIHMANRFGQQSGEALGYKQIIAHLNGQCSLDEAVEEIKIRTRRYAKQQRTWLRRFKRYKRSIWFEGKTFSPSAATEKVIHSLKSAAIIE